MIYNITIKAKVESNLTQDLIEKQLVNLLNNSESNRLKFDAVDYELTEVREICPHCEVELIARIFDIDGMNLIERNICTECAYGTPALI